MIKGWVRRYDLVYPEGATAGLPGQLLATIVLCQDGTFLAHSDFGAFSRWWGHHGYECVRDYLCVAPDDSLVRKLTPRQEYDPDATVKFLREWLNEEGNLGDGARERELALLDRLGNLKTEADFGTWYEATGLDDASEFAVYGPTLQTRLFVENAMPLLRARLRDELITRRTWLTQSRECLNADHRSSLAEAEAALAAAPPGAPRCGVAKLNSEHDVEPHCHLLAEHRGPHHGVDRRAAMPGARGAYEIPYYWPRVEDCVGVRAKAKEGAA